MALTELPEGSYRNIPPNSFSSADILRIFAFHLTRIERLHIMYFFLVVVPATGLITNLFEVIQLLFKPTAIIMKILKFLKLYNSIIERINPINASLLLMVLPKNPREEASRALSVIKREYYLEEL